MTTRLATISAFVREVTDEKEIRTVNLWKSIVAEFIGSFFLVLVGCGSTVKWITHQDPDADVVQISLAFGITYATVVECTRHISGGHINPAVSTAMLFSGRMTVIRYLFYVIGQMIGAMAGSGLLRLVTPPSMLGEGNLGVTSVYVNMSSIQAIAVEFFITLILVLTIFAVRDENRTDLKGSGPLAVGLVVVTCHLLAIPYTGCSMNPARSFGPAVMADSWDRHWIYWLGPILGGVVAAFFYLLLLRAKIRKAEDDVSAVSGLV